jgi:hypothetical protein
MENEIRKLINQVKNFGKPLNENIETEPKTVKEIVGILNKYDIKVSPKEKFYNGSNYGEKYTIIGSGDVDGYTPYLGIPIKVKAQGFITRNGILQNYFFHTSDGFETTKSINEFLSALGK